MKCNKLKSITAYKLTTNTEDSDVYIHNDEFECGGDAVQVYIESEADNLIAELEEKHKKEVLQIRSAFNSLFRQTRTKRAQLRKEKRAAKHALKNLRVAFADAMRQVWSKEVELCYHENVSSRQALTLELFWDKVKDTLKIYP